MVRAKFVLAVVGLVFASAALADEVQFKNGDKITGKIERLEDGKLVITSALAGEVKVPMTEVKTFSTDGPIEILLNDGTLIKQKIVAGEQGRFATAKEGALAPQAFDLTTISKVNPEKPHWTGSIAVGALMTRGNSNTENANVAIHLQRRSDDDRITFDAAYLYGRQKDPNTGDKSTTTDNWFAELKYDYFFTKQFYGYVQARVEKDRIAELNLRLTAGVGVGYQWFDEPDFTFNTEGGVSWFYENYSNETPTNDHVALRLAYHLLKKFNDKVAIFHDLEYYPSLEKLSDYFITTDAGIRATLTKAMFAEFKVQFDYDSTPAIGAKHENIRYLLSVGWGF